MNVGEPTIPIGGDHELLLKAVLASEDTARVAFAEWRARVDIEALDGASNRLLPLLARRLGELAPDDPVRTRIRGVYRHAWVKNQLIVRDAADVAQLLEKHGIPQIVLKGAALLPYYGNDLGARPMYDVDLLVPIDDVADAFAILSDAGWSAAKHMGHDWITQRLLVRRHSVSFSRDLEGQLDLHWHVLSRSLGRRADESFWAGAEPFDLGGVKVLALAPADLLLHLIVHGVRSTSGGHVQWVPDAVHVLRDHGSAMGSRVATMAREHGVLDTVRACLEVIHRITDEPAVERLSRELARYRPGLAERATSSPRMPEPLRRLARGVTRFGGGQTSTRRQLGAFTREALDLDFVHRPVGYTAYVLTGYRPAFARALRRRSGSLARTPGGDAPYVLGTELDLTDSATSVRVAGPGWPTLDRRGLRSFGAESRLVLTVESPVDTDLELELLASSADDRPLTVEVRVNETRVGLLDLAPADDLQCTRLRVTREAAARYAPLEIAFLAHRGLRAALRDSRTMRLRALRLVSKE